MGWFFPLLASVEPEDATAWEPNNSRLIVRGGIFTTVGYSTGVAPNNTHEDL